MLKKSKVYLNITNWVKYFLTICCILSVCTYKFLSFKIVWNKLVQMKLYYVEKQKLYKTMNTAIFWNNFKQCLKETIKFCYKTKMRTT